MPESAVKIYRPWLAPLIACSVAIVLLALLLLPGVLLYPEEPVVVDQAAGDLAAQRETNQALEQRIGLLQAVLDNAQCRAPEGLVLPAGGLPSVPGYPNGLPATVDPATLLPPIPGRSMVVPPGGSGRATEPPGTGLPQGQQGPGPQPSDNQAPAPSNPVPSGPQQSMKLPELLDASTVMVIALGGDGRSATGTGVIVGSGTVLTNRHVIDDVIGDPGGKILLTSKTLGRVVPARIVAASTQAEKPLDLAILESSDIGSLSVLTLTEHVDRMGDVVAAGYPGAILQFDEQFQRLRSGDSSAAPDLAITSGNVTVLQNPESNPIIGHTAPILSGNSGGPLVDFCGRLMGINTFGPTGVQTIGYAQSAKMVQRFLSREGVNVTSSNSRCQPVSAPVQVTAPAAETEAQPQQPISPAPSETGQSPQTGAPGTTQ